MPTQTLGERTGGWLEDNVSALNAQLAIAVSKSVLSDTNKNDLYMSIINNKNTDIEDVNDALLAESNAIHGLYYYQGRNSQLNDVNQSLVGTTTGQANALVSDNDLAKRQNEINEWETGNKLDTLFIYQQLLIILCATVILSYIWKTGIIGNTVFIILLVLLGLIFIFTVVNRAQYTNLKRDTRYWNQRRFPTTGVSSVSACDVVNELESNVGLLSGALADLGGFGTSNTGTTTSGI